MDTAGESSAGVFAHFGGISCRTESWWRGFRSLADAPAIGRTVDSRIDSSPLPHPARADSSLSLKSAWLVLSRRRRLVLSVVAGSLLVCLLYCLLAPPQFEAK